MPKIQGADIATTASLIAAGATAASLPTDNQIYVTANGLNETLHDAIVANAFSVGVLTNVHVTGTTQTIAAGNRYFADNASMVVFTLPVNMTAYSGEFAVVGVGAGGWQIAQNAGQSIVKDISTSNTGTGGYISSGASRSCVHVFCTVANNEFQVVDSQGSINVKAGSTGITYGYKLGGDANAGTGSTTIERLVFSNESNATIAAVLGANTKSNPATVSGTAGYSEGGANSGGTQITTIYKLTFVGETTSTLAAVLSAARLYGAGVQSSTSGYVLGGFNGTTAVTTIDKLNFSNDTNAGIVTVLTTARQNTSGGSSSTKGYAFGGDGTTSIEAIVFSGDTNAAVSSVLSGIDTQTASGSSSLATYIIGGSTGGTAQTKVQKLTFSGEVMSTLAAVLPSARRNGCAITSVNKVYYSGGTDSGASYTSTIYPFTISGETMAAALAATTTYATGNCPAGVSV